MLRKRKIRGTIDNKVLDGYFPPTFPGYLIAEEVKALVGTLRISVEELIDKLLPLAATRAFVPVSGFRVGSICRGESGNFYFGANIEFPGESLSSAIHAEQAAIANAASFGETSLKAVAVSTPPCGGCRQFMVELNGAEDLKIYLPGKDPHPLIDLLPFGFGPGDLGSDNRLLKPQDHPLQLVKQTDEELVLKALDAASRSYAPYSGCYSAVALETKRGFIVTGSYMENAAFNNSLLPLQSAIAILVMRAYSFSDIQRALLVQTRDARIDLAAATRQTLQSISQTPLEIVLASAVPS
ncbi:cytidine deaminase [bacterium]|nr:cytidine deaminase [bacterium]